jgi:hypothetical protein
MTTTAIAAPAEAHGTTPHGSAVGAAAVRASPGEAHSFVAPGAAIGAVADRPRARGGAPTLNRPHEVIVSTIERSLGTELRVSVVQLPRRRLAWLSVCSWVRSGVGDDWRPDSRPTRIRPVELPLVIEALQRGVERARELGWDVR